MKNRSKLATSMRRLRGCISCPRGEPGQSSPNRSSSSPNVTQIIRKCGPLITRLQGSSPRPSSAQKQSLLSEELSFEITSLNYKETRGFQAWCKTLSARSLKILRLRGITFMVPDEESAKDVDRLSEMTESTEGCSVRVGLGARIRRLRTTA